MSLRLFSTKYNGAFPSHLDYPIASTVTLTPPKPQASSSATSILCLSGVAAKW